MPALISDRDLPTVEAIINDYRAGRLQNRPGGGGGRIPPRLRFHLAKVTTAAIAANSSGEITIQAKDWTDTERMIPDCLNEFPVELPVGTKLYVLRFAGAWRVIVPFLECPA